jgi:hypothetical protein
MTKAKAAPAPRRTLATFKATHDPAVIIPNKIKAALEQMRREGGDEAYAYEFSDPAGVPFSKLAGVSIVHLNQYRDQFSDYTVQVKQDTGSRRGPRWVWFATPKAAKVARGA